MTGSSDDPIYALFRSKREITRLQILVEVAEHQPAVRQLEIADKLGVTPQAVSEYIRELVDEGMITARGRGRYEVTRPGVEWVLSHAEVIESYARHVRRDIIQQVSVWTAIASEDLRAGDLAGVFMQEGILFAGHAPESATGAVVLDARKGEDVGVTRLSGLIDHREGKVHVCKVPRVEKGGSRMVRKERLREVIAGAGMVAAVGLEAVVALRKAGREPDLFFGAREGVIEAAFHGLDAVVVIVDGEFTGFLQRLEAAGLSYVIHDLVGT